MKKINNLMTIFLIQLILMPLIISIDAYALAISNVRVTKTTSNSAVIEWDTDVPANGKVKYGVTTALGFTQRHENFVEKHSVTVFNGITSDTLYFFAVESTDASSITAIANNSDKFYTFKTTDITPPPQVTGLKALSRTSSSIFLSWDNVNAADLSHYVVYRDRIAVANSTKNSFNDTGLEPNKNFNYKVSAVDTSGNEGQQSDTLIAITLAVDALAPVISNIDALLLIDTTAEITWLTNENATSVVLYGVGNPGKEKIDAILKTNHSVIVEGLTKNAKYVFAVKSCDAANNCAVSKNNNFIAEKDIVPPVINMSIPRYVNRRVIDITGNTEPFSSVSIFVNNLNVPKKTFSSEEMGSGKFALSQIQLQQDNIIKITAADKSGNKNEKTFEVSIDTEAPIVQLKEIPPLASKTGLNITGTANEPVAINVFVDALPEETPMPSKITGLKAEKIAQNSVELKWQESRDKDFSHYVVYRDNEAIALTKPANFNFFIDLLVDSNKEYTYQVTAVNIFAIESQKSEPVAVKTLPGGAILNLKHPPVDIFEDFRKPSLSLNLSDKFEFGLKLDKGDGTYKIKLIFEDRAQNKVIVEKTISLDTKRPEVKITSPPSGALVYENVAGDIDIIGKTEPNARVHLFVDRTPFTFYDAGAEISGLPSDILPSELQSPQLRLPSFDITLRGLEERLENLSEAELDAKCRSASGCRTGADRSVTADNEGNFKFERVDLTAFLGGAARLREVPATQLRDIQLHEETREAKTTNIVIIATDVAGQRGVATRGIRMGTCWTGNQSWDVIPLTQHQNPALLSTERLAEGKENIYFYFNYSYIGRGTNARITGVSIQKACSEREQIDPRFNISCQIMPSGASAKPLNPPENTISYSNAQLGRFPGMDRFLENDWKGFLKAINRELTFPLKIRITYKHRILDGGVEKEVTEVQTTCEQVSYVVDSTLIDPRKVLGNWMLYDFVDYLQDSIKTLNEVQQQIDKVVNYVAAGCLFSMGAHIGTKIYRNWVEFADERVLLPIKGVLPAFGLGSPNEDDYCTKLREAVKSGYGSPLKLEYFSDADLEKCFPKSYAAWKAEEKTYQLQRWSCDRIFGHASPSKWTETKNDKELLKKIDERQLCAADQSVEGLRLRAQKCVNINLAKYGKRRDDFDLDNKCFEVTIGNEEVLLQLGSPERGNIYRVTEEQQRPSRVKISYAIKDERTQDYYLTASPQSCEERCGIKPNEKKSNLVFEGDKAVLRKEGNTDKGVIPVCTTVNKCTSLNKGDRELQVGETLHKVESAYTRGYASRISAEDASPCFYDGTNPSAVADSPATREECCCINTKETKPGPIEGYYQPDDIDGRTYEYAGNIQGFNPFVHKSKSVPLSEPLPQTNDQEGFSDMKWSYRYSRIGYLDNKIYNPDRYIEGRDLPACFGQDNLFYKAFNSEEKVLMLNPAKEYTATLQCAYLTGINQRLQLFQNIMNAMSNCLIQIRTDGRADAGVCKELFTQHVCGLIWQGISFFIDGCAQEAPAVNINERENKFAEYTRRGFRSIFQGISEAQQEITEEYQNYKLTNLLGTGSDSVARKICLGAFGYDWPVPNVRNLVDAAYSTPMATLVQPVTKSREFLTVDPETLRPRYEYRASWLINPGCDLESYKVELACVSRKEVEAYNLNCGAVGAPSIAYTGQAPFTGPSTGYNACDCLELEQEKSRLFWGAESRLKQNVLIERSHHDIYEENYRYDHLKFTLRPDRRILPNIQQNCFPSGHEDGVFYAPLTQKAERDIADCTIQPLTGVISCEGAVPYFARKGIAQLIEVTINGENADKFKEETAGTPLSVGARVSKTGKDKCIRVSISPDRITPQTEGITIDGISDIAPILVTDQLRVAGARGNVVARGISHDLKAQQNEDIVTISIKAFDNADKNAEGYRRYSTDDEVIIDGTEKIDFGNQEQQGDEKTIIFVKGKTITIEKQGAKIEISDITYNSPQTEDGNYELQEIITIYPQQQVGQSEEQKTVLVEIFNIKEDRESYTNIEDCNFNDKLIERNYKFKVTIKGADAARLEPSIQNLRVPARAKIGDVITISARITHAAGIDKAEVTITDPNGIEVAQQERMDKITDDFEYRFDTSNMPEGEYRGFIEATSSTGTKGRKAFNFRLEEPKSNAP